jgi:hypothetical protein
LGETVSGRKPIWLSFEQLGKHLLILGATGGGKSNSLLWITTRAIRAGYGAIVIDMKADPGLLERMQAEAGLWGRPFYRWRIDGDTQLYNPLKRGNSTARRDRLVASQAFSEDYYRGLFSTHSKAVLDALEASGREPTLAAMAEWWDVQDLRASVRAIQDEQAREKVSDYCERVPRAQLEHIASLRSRIVEVTDTAAGETLRSGSSLAFELDLLDALERRSIVVLSINADSYPGAAATIGNLALQDLVGTVGELRQARRKVRSVVAVDEFGALSGEQLGRLLSTSRDVGVPAILAGQDLAQLRRVSEHFEAEVKANISGLIAHRQSEPDSAEQIARICGTEEVVVETHQVDRLRAPRPGSADAAYATGVGSSHIERDFRIGPDQVKDLDNGEAAVRLWNPATVELVRMCRCESAEELVWLSQKFEAEGMSRPLALRHLLKWAEDARWDLDVEVAR